MKPGYRKRPASSLFGALLLLCATLLGPIRTVESQGQPYPYPVSNLALSPDGDLLAVSGRVILGEAEDDPDLFPIDVLDVNTGEIAASLDHNWAMIF